MFCKMFLVVVFYVLVSSCFADKICKVPKGNAGTCIQMSKCKPLWDLYKQKRHTNDEHLYLRQSYCGNNQSSKIKMCCPHNSEWSNFTVNPVIFPEQNVGVLFQVPPITKDAIDHEYREPCGVEAEPNKITGGFETSRDHYPWLVLLDYGGESPECGGSLISRRFVLTAAHCIDYRLPLFARLGDYSIKTEPAENVDEIDFRYYGTQLTVIQVESGLPHPTFSRTMYHDNIGLVKLARNAPYTDFIRHICLPTRNYIAELDSEIRFTMAMREDVGDKALNKAMKSLTLAYVELYECRKTQSRVVYDTQICAGGGEDTCRGDSGGPLMYEHDETTIAMGIISHGSKICEVRDRPAVFTYVYRYRDWINNVTGI